MNNPLHPDRMSPAERLAELGRILAAGLIRLKAQVQYFICRQWREFCRLFAPEERSCNGTQAETCMTTRPHPRAPGGAEDHADAGAEAAVARPVRDRAAALQPALSSKAGWPTASRNWPMAG